MAVSVASILTPVVTENAKYYLGIKPGSTVFEAICFGLGVLHDDLAMDVYYEYASAEEAELERQVMRFLHP